MTTAGTNAGGKAPSKLDELMNAPLKATGGDVPPGSYGGVLFGFSEPIEMDATKSKFYKQGQPAVKLMFEASFGILDKTGGATFVELFMPFPDGGAANRKSTLYKTLKALATGTSLMDADGNFSKGTTLKSFVGLKAVLTVKNNDREFPNVESVAPPIEGARYPTMEQLKAIPMESDNIPF